MERLIFIEFIYALKEGKRLRQVGWSSNTYIQCVNHPSSSYSDPYIKQTHVLGSGAEEYQSYELNGFDLFIAQWVEFTEDK